MRKKTILLSMLLPLAALIAACSGQEDITTEQPPQLPETQLRPMTFRAGESIQTRATETAITEDMYPLFLCGKHIPNEGGTEVTASLPDNTLLEWQDGDGFVGKYVAKDCYWPKEGQMRFCAFSSSYKLTDHRISARITDEGKFEVHFPKNTITGHDNIMYAMPELADCAKPVEPTLHFKHATNRVVITLSNGGKGKKQDKFDRTVKVNSIDIDELVWGGTLTVEDESRYTWTPEGDPKQDKFELDGTLTSDKITNKENVLCILYIPTGQTLNKVKVNFNLYDENENLVDGDTSVCSIKGGLVTRPVTTVLELDSQYLIDDVFEGQQMGTIVPVIIEENGMPE